MGVQEFIHPDVKLKLSVPLVLSLFFGLIKASNVESMSSTYGALEVVDYKQYSSLQMLRFYIPPETTKVFWRFRSFPNVPECAGKAVAVHIQAGSFPLVTPNGEMFPEKFYVNRTDEYMLTVPCQNHSDILTVHQPISGEWYAAAYTTSTTEKILQKGIAKDCKYFLEPTMSLDVLKEVTSVDSRNGLVFVESGTTKYARFYLDEAAWTYRVVVTGCGSSVNQPSLSAPLCNIVIRARSSALPARSKWQGETTCLSNQTTECALRVTSPEIGKWQYLSFSNNGPENLNVEFNLDITACFEQTSAHRAQLGNTSNMCSIMPQLDRFVGYGDFSSQFGLLIMSSVVSVQVILVGHLTLVVPLHLDYSMDLGGTLKVELTAHSLIHTGGRNSVMVVYGCLQKSSIGFNRDQLIPCDGQLENQFKLDLSESSSQTDTLSVPYPEPAIWFLSLTAICYSNTSHTNLEECGSDSVLTEMVIQTASCVDGSCENSGSCYTYLRGSNRFSSCSCLAGWRGYGCTDGTEASSHSAQLEEALLLTLSNLLFIPAIILAIYRSFYCEALVYFCTMFFSAFYHACDGNRILTYCLAKYDILSACDFFGSVLAFWVTLVAMLRVKEPFQPTLIMAGAIGIIYGTLDDKHSLWLYVAPAISGFVLLFISWGLQCYRRHTLYPSWKRYVFCLLPGALCALLGICLFAFVETGLNYKYVHSVWHVTMALSIVFVLPPTPGWKEATQKEGVHPLNERSDEDCIHVISNSPDRDLSNGGIVNLSMNDVH